MKTDDFTSHGQHIRVRSKGSEFLQEASFHIVKVRCRSSAPITLDPPFSDSTGGPFKRIGLSAIYLEDAYGTSAEIPCNTNSDILKEDVLPVLFGGHPTAYPELFHTLYWRIRNRGFRGSASSTLGAVDLAMHALWAERQGLSLHRLLGATRDWCCSYGSGGSTELTLAALLEQMGSFVERGFQCVKMKVGKRFGTCVDEDIGRVKAVRDRIGPEIGLAVDANQVYAASEAIAFAKAIADQDIAWFEEPVHSADYQELKAYCAESPIIAAVGESESSALGFDSIAAAGCRHLQPGLLAGVFEFLSVCRYAEAHRLDLSAGGLSYFVSQIMAVNSESALTEILLPVIEPLRPYLKTAADLQEDRFILDNTKAVSTSIDWELLAEKNMLATDETFTPDDFRDSSVSV